jgi:hypothetical protein
VFDNWKLVKTITSSDNEKGYADVPIGSQSKWNIYKLELEGKGVTLEPLRLISRKQK